MTSELFALLCREDETRPVDFCFMDYGDNPQPVNKCIYSNTKSAGSEHRGRRGGSRKNVGGNGAEK
jgi:hypothetical protein